MARTPKCDGSGECRYEITGAWEQWGRWLFLALMVVFVILLFPFFGYLMSRRRVQRGLPPVNGCAWMFPNPFKDANKIDQSEYEQQQSRPPRYRPPNVYRQYQQQLNEQYMANSAQQSTDGTERTGTSASNYYPPESGSESENFEKHH